VEYPIAFTLEMVFGTARQGAEASAWAADHLAKWANQRFELSWDPQTVLTMNGEQIHRTLVEAAEAWQGPKLDAWVSAVVKAGDTAKMAEMFGQRWGMPIDAASLKDDAASKLRRAALDVMRTELTQLERYVLLQILDQSWKDHLYAMDQLKDSVGLRGFAEKDPKIEYKAEGSRMFQQMLSGVRDKVTDLIFKARLTAQVQMRSVYQNQQAQHEVVESTGVNAAASIAGSAEQEADLAAAQQAGSGGEKPAVQQIVNDGSNVGRNELCPCGSGKKYKKCCGTAA
jgi:preprotein translocase subunit SecA